MQREVFGSFQFYAKRNSNAKNILLLIYRIYEELIVLVPFIQKQFFFKLLSAL